jgi:hypothetical protein
MSREHFTMLLLAIAGGFLVPAPVQAQTNPKLSKPAYDFLKTYCAGCHHGAKPMSEVEDYDVLNYASLTKKRTDDDGKPYYYVKAGAKGKAALKASELWRHAGLGEEADMPPKKFKNKEVKPIPTDKERAILQKWLEAGAPAFSPKRGKGAVSVSPRRLLVPTGYLISASVRVQPIISEKRE